MKKLLSLCMLLCALSHISYGQITEKKNVSRHPSGQEKPVYFLDNVQMDARAIRQYKTEDQIKQMPTYKKLQVNYYFQKSYELFIPEGSALKAEEFDVTQYETQRKQDSRNRVSIKDAAGAYVVLHSRAELESAYEKIQEENSK